MDIGGHFNYPRAPSPAGGHEEEASKGNNLNVFSRMSVKSGKLKSPVPSRDRPPRNPGGATGTGPALSSMLASGAVSGLRPTTPGSPPDASTSPTLGAGSSAGSPGSGVPRPHTSSHRSSSGNRTLDGNRTLEGFRDREVGAMDPPRSARDSRSQRRSKELQTASNFRSCSSGSKDRSLGPSNSPPNSSVSKVKSDPTKSDPLDALVTLADFPVPMKATQDAEKLEAEQHSREPLHRRSGRPGSRGASGTPHNHMDTATPSTAFAASPVPTLGSSQTSPLSGAGDHGRSDGAGGLSPELPGRGPRRRGATGADDPPHTSRFAEGGSRLMEGGAAMLSARGPRPNRGVIGQDAPGRASPSHIRPGTLHLSAASPRPGSSEGALAPDVPKSPRTAERESRLGELHELLSPELTGPKRAPPDNRTLEAAKPEQRRIEARTEAAKERKKPKSLSQNTFEFKPISRSSSESSLPTTSPANKAGARNQGDEHGRGLSTTSSIHSSRPSLTTTYVNFDKFDLQIENGRAPTQLASWDQLLAVVADKEWSVRQAIEWYGWVSPTKFQAVAIPCIIQACRNVGDAKSYTLLQAAEGLGKTSAVALGLLASVRQEVKSLQFILVALEGCEELEKYMNALGCLSEIKVVYFKDAEPETVQTDVEAAQGAQIIVGHPAHVCTVLKEAQDRLVLNTFEAMFMDDASNLISEGLVQKVCEINQILGLFAQKPPRYVVVSDFIGREAKPALRALKSSLMSKKNMFDLSHQVGRIRKFVKHYSLRGEPENWVSSLLRLRTMIYIPRAVIFCDCEKRFQELKRKFTRGVRCEDGKELSVAIMDSKLQTQDQRRGSLQSFCKEQQDFLLTRSEPNIFQASLPRVFWIIHFGVESSNLSWYGCRLLCLDSQLRQKAGKGPQHDGVSILFMPNEKKEQGKEKDTVPKLEKMFGIKFESLPFGDL